MAAPRLLRIVAAALLALACAGCAAAAAPPPTPRPSDVQLVIDPTYRSGSTMAVRLHNPTDRTFYYNQYYAACDLTYRDAAGRSFRIPKGTHCDLVLYVPIAPGETVTLFSWDLTECIRDEWGCVEEAPLPAGTYTIAGTFIDTPDYRDTTGSTASASFAIVP